MPTDHATPTRCRLPAPVAALAHVAPLAPAAFAVHQLRYMLAFGTSAGIELQRSGHSYLHSAVPWIAAVLALIAGGFLRALGRTVAGHTSLPRYTVSLAGMWAACSLALIAVFVCQETLEGLFIAGHPAGFAGVFGYGGWWAVPAAVCIGLVLAAWFHGARWVLRQVARRRAASRPLVVAPAGAPVAHARSFWMPTAVPVVAGWSGRGPPQG
ncbi:MAG TPA: hypothetical protein VG223_14980 [Solirubrobacteraceae bacterium]|jgi:hypothetical protein|nr:hypothetical protein [Solirubrobacteraceae bacterium]